MRHAPAIKILVVDDHQEILQIVARFLRHEGFDVLEAHTPEIAISACASDTDVQILLSDYHMPGLNGLELGLALRALRPGIRMVFMTGDPATESNLRSAGFYCVPKPLFFTDVLNVLNQAVKTPRQEI